MSTLCDVFVVLAVCVLVYVVFGAVNLQECSVRNVASNRFRENGRLDVLPVRVFAAWIEIVGVYDDKYKLCGFCSKKTGLEV